MAGPKHSLLISRPCNVGFICTGSVPGRGPAPAPLQPQPYLAPASFPLSVAELPPATISSYRHRFWFQCLFLHRPLPHPAGSSLYCLPHFFPISMMRTGPVAGAGGGDQGRAPAHGPQRQRARSGGAGRHVHSLPPQHPGGAELLDRRERDIGPLCARGAAAERAAAARVGWVRLRRGAWCVVYRQSVGVRASLELHGTWVDRVSAIGVGQRTSMAQHRLMGDVARCAGVVVDCAV